MNCTNLLSRMLRANVILKLVHLERQTVAIVHYKICRKRYMPERDMLMGLKLFLYVFELDTLVRKFFFQYLTKAF